METPGQQAVRQARAVRLKELEAEIPKLEQTLKERKAELRELTKKWNQSNSTAAASPPALNATRFATNNTDHEGDA